MKKYYFILVIFIGAILSLFFVKTANAAGICDMDFTDAAGTKMSASDWCTACRGEIFNFCEGNIHYSFGCKSGPFGICSCDENNTEQETCTAGCIRWYCNKEFGYCVDGSCNQAKTCSQLGGVCCSTDKICSDKILGASDCGDKCCKDASKCSLPCTNPSKTDKICTAGCNVDQDPDCGCKGGNGVCPPGCTSGDDSDCSSCVNPIKGDKKCTPGCNAVEDPECYCIHGDYYCGVVGCDYTSDSDCAKTCSQFGKVCCPDGTECGVPGAISGALNCITECCDKIDNCLIPEKYCLPSGGQCCSAGQVCAPGKKIPGISGCSECCEGTGNCIASVTPSETTPGDGTTPGGSTQVFSGKLESPIKAETFEELVGAINNFIFWVAIALAPILFIIAGFFILTAGANPKQVATGRNIMIYTAIGLAVILFAKGLVAVLQNVLGVVK